MAEQSPDNPAPNPVSPIFIPADWNLTSPISASTSNNVGIIGQVIIVGKISLPSADWLWCDGASYSIVTYARLFSVIGYTYGGSGGTFSVPNLLAKTPLGADTFNILQTLYQGSNTVSSGNRTMTENQLPIHRHTYLHTHDFTYAYTYNTANNGNTINTLATSTSPVLQNVATTSNIITTTDTTSNPNTNQTANIGGSLEWLPPFSVVNFCIRCR